MILVVSHGQDAHVPFVTRRLDERGAAWTLLDTDAYPTVTRIADGPSGAVLTIAEQPLKLASVRSVWWRRPRPPQIRDREDEAVSAWAQRQAFAAMDSALSATQAVWVNHPRCNRSAEDKPANLRRAVALGLDVPDWCVTNDSRCALAFRARHDEIIVKAVESAHVGPGRALWTKRVTDDGWLERIGPEPYLLQRFVDKIRDVRVTIVGDDVFAVAIGSQADPATAVDLRAAGRLDELDHDVEALPESVSRRLLELARALDLRFAAIDLAVDGDGRYWFLELNPNGQWAWLQQRTGVPIAEAIARALG